MAYITNLTIDSTDVLLGNSMFGICDSYASDNNKTVTLNGFDSIDPNVSIHVKFTHGNSVTDSCTLQVGQSSAYTVVGMCTCDDNEILTFVFDSATIGNERWRVVGHNVVTNNNLPAAIGTAAAGSSSAYARQDHVHPIDVSVTNLQRGQISIAGSVYTIPGIGGGTYAICAAEANSRRKTITVSGFTLTAGTTIQIKFTNENSLENWALLNVSETGFYPIVQLGPDGWERTLWNAGAILTLTFDGEAWIRDNETHVAGASDSGYVTSIAYDENTHVLGYRIDYGSLNTILTLGDLVTANASDYIGVASFQPFDMIYFNASRQPTRIAANATQTKKFLRMTGVPYVDPDTHIESIIGSAPVWDTLSPTDLGFNRIITNIAYNSSTGEVTVTANNSESFSLFTLGANALSSGDYLPLAGGELTGALSFADASTITWNTTVPHRIQVTNNAFIFQEKDTENNTWNNLFTINNTGVTANTFIGALNGTASYAINLQPQTTNLNNLTGITSFSTTTGDLLGQIVGLQLGSDNAKLQIAQTPTSTVIRTYTNNTWSNWATLLTDQNITTGDNNGQIKVGSTNINVRGLGALAYKDTIDSTDLITLDLYVTISGAQTITGTKTFNNIIIPTSTQNTYHKLTFEDIDLYYQNDALTIEAAEDTTIDFMWDNVSHSFTETSYITNGSIFPTATGDHYLGTDQTPWTHIYATSFHGNLIGNATTATSATQDSDGLAINTNYLKLSGGEMRGRITTQQPINQILTVLRDNIVEDNSLEYPECWSYNGTLNPNNGDIITIKTPSNGTVNGVFLSLDNRAHYYPITLSGNLSIGTEYPAGTCLTLIFDNTNSTTAYPITGAATRQSISGGTWRVINYYDSGAPYGIRVYKGSYTSTTDELPLLISKTTLDEYGLSSAAYINNVYGYLNDTPSRIPTYNPYTGAITATQFKGYLDGNAKTAVAFETAAKVKLVGDITGEADSTKGWEVTTTIGYQKVTNDMLAGQIAKGKILDDVVKTFTRAETINSTTAININDYSKNGLVYYPTDSEKTISGNTTVLDVSGALLNLLSTDKHVGLQILGTGDAWYIRGYGDNSSTFNSIFWRRIVVERDVTPAWNISIQGAAGKATCDGNDNVITTTYATKGELENLLASKDAFVFKGLLTDSATAQISPSDKYYDNLPTAGYSAGWTYKVAVDGTFAGQACEAGDVIIAINDGPTAQNDTGNVRIADWAIIQTNIANPVQGPNINTQVDVTNEFAIYSNNTGRLLGATHDYMYYLAHTPTQAGSGQTVSGYIDGILIKGATQNTSSGLLSNVAGQLMLGDAGPQIRFHDSGAGSGFTGAMIFNGHSDDAGAGVTFDFLSNSTATALKADNLIAKSKLVIGQPKLRSDTALYVKGDTILHGDFTLESNVLTQSGVSDQTFTFKIEYNNNRFKFRTIPTDGAFEFGGSVYLAGNLIPAANQGDSSANYRTLGTYNSSTQEIHSWQAVFIGQKATYGGNTNPIYWKDGTPYPIDYSGAVNRIFAAFPGASAGDAATFGPTLHYISDHSMSVNSSQPPPQIGDNQTVTLYVNGNTFIDGSINIKNSIAPRAKNESDLGMPSLPWRALYVGPNEGSNYGDKYTPIYWNSGVPTATSIVQKMDFDMFPPAQGQSVSETVLFHEDAYTNDTIVLQIVVTSGQQYMSGPINWSNYDTKNIKLTMSPGARGRVHGYILTARGIDITPRQQEANANDGNT